MILPVVLIILALLAMAVVAYGTSPGWAQLEHGVQFICLSRRMQWPLVALALILCVALIGLVIAGRRRAWWLVGLAPVLALFAHKFPLGGRDGPAVLEGPQFVAAADAEFIADDDWVVGLRFGDTAYAYPYAALFRHPVIVQQDHDRRMVLLWSAYANRVLAFHVGNDLKARDLEVTSTPANALLVYDTRLGQFVNGVTGLTSSGEVPTGFKTPILTTKTTWKQWRAAHADGQVLRTASPAAGATGPPAKPILPAYGAYRLSASPGDPSRRQRVAVIGTTRPAAVPTEQLGTAPINLRADGEPALAFRPTLLDPPRAFDRRFGEQFRPRFLPFLDRKHPTARFKDTDTSSLWNANAKVVVTTVPEVRGKSLTPIPVDDGVDWAVMKYWFPDLQLHQPEVDLPPRGLGNH